MHQSGHSREHFQQTVQLASFSAMTPRVRAGRSGFSSGYCCVTAGRSMCLRVTPRPLIRPWPTARPEDLRRRTSFSAMATTLPRSLADRDLDQADHDDLYQREWYQPEPRELLELVLPQPRVGRPQPDHEER